MAFRHRTYAPVDLYYGFHAIIGFFPKTYSNFKNKLNFKVSSLYLMNYINLQTKIIKLLIKKSYRIPADHKISMYN